ncbi:ABC transporter permease [Actinoplanes sp. NPDC026619]|uniref:ABC transporter permease n=1 Tax=Actinoplanes sp. NPDC026619 TaxID=3155798 RepID=UPI0034023F52
MSSATAVKAPSPWTHVAGAVVLLSFILSVLVTAFAWPAARSAVHDIPIAVAGPAAATAQVTAALEQRLPGGFDITTVADTSAAETAINNREVYGAIDLSTGQPQVLTASAASPVVAQTLQGIAAALSQSEPAAAVRDLAPLPADDPRGAGLAAGALPLVIGGMFAAVALTTRIRGTARRVIGALSYAVAGGLAMSAILQFWLGSLDGTYVLNAGVMALSLAATSLTLLGLESLFGFAGFGLGAAVIFLLGNPLSGAASAPEMLPGWSGALGQLLPPGAAISLVRAVAFFDGGFARPLTVLLSWLAFGLLLSAASAFRPSRRRTPATPATQPDAAPALV